MKFPERMVLSNADRETVLPLLKRALVGKHLCGIHFYFTPIVLVNYPDAPSDASEAFITIESAWRREERLRGDWPSTEADLPELRDSEYQSVVVSLYLAGGVFRAGGGAGRISDPDGPRYSSAC